MTKRFRQLRLPLLLALSLVCAGVQAQTDGGLKQRMSESDFSASGLNKLTPDELAHLDQWLGNHAKVKTKVVTSSGKPVFYTESSERKKFRTHIVGAFSGWHGNDTVTLDNGQQWQQVGDDQPSCSSSSNPVATVKPSLFGNWLMYVSGCNDTVHVKRLK